jgi:hypothetical protein
MNAEGRLHSMSDHERALALDVLSTAWAQLAETTVEARPILGVVREVAATLSEQHADVSREFAHHVGEAAVWYLDRAVRRVGDPDRDGLTAGRRALNLQWFGSTASTDDLERLFAMASALNAEDE